MSFIDLLQAPTGAQAITSSRRGIFPAIERVDANTSNQSFASHLEPHRSLAGPGKTEQKEGDADIKTSDNKSRMEKPEEDIKNDYSPLESVDRLAVDSDEILFDGNKDTDEAKKTDAIKKAKQENIIPFEIVPNLAAENIAVNTEESPALLAMQKDDLPEKITDEGKFLLWAPVETAIDLLPGQKWHQGTDSSEHVFQAGLTQLNKQHHFQPVIVAQQKGTAGNNKAEMLLPGPDRVLGLDLREGEGDFSLLNERLALQHVGPAGLKEGFLFSGDRNFMMENHAVVSGRATSQVFGQTLSGQMMEGDTKFSSDFGKRFGEQILWMRQQNIQVAELRLNPRDLGSILVRIDSTGDNSSVNFVAQSPHVRSVLDQNLPRLQELFSQAGIQLGNTDISDGSSRQNREPGGFPHGVTGSYPDRELDSAVGQIQQTGLQESPIYIVDFFA